MHHHNIFDLHFWRLLVLFICGLRTFASSLTTVGVLWLGKHMNTLTWRSRVPVSKTRFGHWKQIATLWYEYTMYYRCTCIIYIFSKCLMLIFLSCPIPRSIDIVLTYYHIQLEYSMTKLILNDIINQTFYSHTLFGQKGVCSLQWWWYLVQFVTLLAIYHHPTNNADMLTELCQLSSR